jgi:hypothetical protein
MILQSTLNLASAGLPLPEASGPAMSDLPFLPKTVTGLVPDIIDNPKGKRLAPRTLKLKRSAGGSIFGGLAALASHDWGTIFHRL